MSLEGGEAWKLTDAKENVSAYSWAPDGSRIAFVATDARSADEEANIKKRDDERVFEGDFRFAHAWVVDVDTKQATRITEGTTWTVQGAPSWSPDGKQFVFGAATTPMLRDNRRDVYRRRRGDEEGREDQHQLGQRRHAAVVAGRRDDRVGRRAQHDERRCPTAPRTASSCSSA